MSTTGPFTKKISEMVIMVGGSTGCENMESKEGARVAGSERVFVGVAGLDGEEDSVAVDSEAVDCADSESEEERPDDLERVGDRECVRGSVPGQPSPFSRARTISCLPPSGSSLPNRTR
jgi:hypothetical protein